MCRATLFAVVAACLAGCGATRPLVDPSTSAKATAAASAARTSGESDAILSQCAVILPDQLAEVPTGRWGVVTRRDGHSSCEGEITHASAEEVVLANGWARTTSGTPVLEKVPSIGRLFRNTGVARFDEQTVRRDEMASVVVYDEQESARKLAEAARRSPGRTHAPMDDQSLDVTGDEDQPTVQEGMPPDR